MLTILYNLKIQQPLIQSLDPCLIGLRNQANNVRKIQSYIALLHY